MLAATIHVVVLAFMQDACNYRLELELQVLFRQRAPPQEDESAEAMLYRSRTALETVHQSLTVCCLHATTRSCLLIYRSDQVHGMTAICILFAGLCTSFGQPCRPSPG